MKKRKWPLPKTGYRIVIYCILIVFAVLALFQVATEYFPMPVGILFYAVAGIFMAVSVYCLIWDIPKIQKNMKYSVVPGILKHIPQKKVEDPDYRLLVSTEFSLAMNLVFGAFNGFLSIIGPSVWSGIMAFYYMTLGLMRFGAVCHRSRIIKKHEQNAKKILLKEIQIYRISSILFIIMAAVLAGAVILLIHAEGGAAYPGFTIYAFALYTFIRVGLAVKNRIIASKQRSPFLITLHSIGYIDALVAILTLQTAMFAAFSDMNDFLAKCMNGITGSAVCLIIFVSGVAGIMFSGKMKKEAKANRRS